MNCPVAFHSRENPEETALLWGRRSLSWANLNDYVHGTCKALKENGVRAGDCFAVLSENALETAIVLLSAWRAGASVRLFDPARFLSFGGKIPEESGIDLLFLDAKNYKIFSGQYRLIRLDKVVCKYNAFVPARELPGIDPNAPAFLLPRNLSADQVRYDTFFLGPLCDSARQDNHNSGYGTGKIWLLPFPLYYLWGQRIFLRGITGGGAILFADIHAEAYKDHKQFAAILEFYKITHLFSPLEELSGFLTSPVLIPVLRNLDAVFVEKSSLFPSLAESAALLSIPLKESVD